MENILSRKRLLPHLKLMLIYIYGVNWLIFIISTGIQVGHMTSAKPLYAHILNLRYCGVLTLTKSLLEKKKLSVTTEGSGSSNAILRQKRTKRKNNRILTVKESLFFR